MDRTLLVLSTAVVCALSPGFNPAVSAQSETFVIMKSDQSDRCLHVKDGDKPAKAVIKVSDPCQTTADFRVERRQGEILRIKVTPNNFVCLQVNKPLKGQEPPFNVTAGNCVSPVSEWSVVPEGDGFMKIVLRRDEFQALCLQEHPDSSQVVVAPCTATSKWKFQSVSPP